MNLPEEPSYFRPIWLQELTHEDCREACLQFSVQLSWGINTGYKGNTVLSLSLRFRDHFVMCSCLSLSSWVHYILSRFGNFIPCFLGVLAEFYSTGIHSCPVRELLGVDDFSSYVFMARIWKHSSKWSTEKSTCKQSNVLEYLPISLQHFFVSSRYSGA